VLTLCPIIAKTAQKLKSHVVRSHFGCSSCTRTFGSDESRRSHGADKHGDPVVKRKSALKLSSRPKRAGKHVTWAQRFGTSNNQPPPQPPAWFQQNPPSMMRQVPVGQPVNYNPQQAPIIYQHSPNFGHAPLQVPALAAPRGHRPQLSYSHAVAQSSLGHHWRSPQASAPTPPSRPPFAQLGPNSPVVVIWTQDPVKALSHLDVCLPDVAQLVSHTSSFGEGPAKRLSLEARSAQACQFLVNSIPAMRSNNLNASEFKSPQQIRVSKGNRRSSARLQDTIKQSDLCKYFTAGVRCPFDSCKFKCYANSNGSSPDIRATSPWV
jgi:hypothetical protein